MADALMLNKCKVYNDLAWTDLVINPPQDSRDEADFYCQMIIKNAKVKPESLLHLGCGAGIFDSTFKQYFGITGVDLNRGMLKIASELNPEVTYLQADMRAVCLKRQFDAVIIPDSIGYMTTIKDVIRTIRTAGRHLKQDGILLIVTPLKNHFRNNNFTYTGKKEDTEITIFENNYLISQSKYEATFVYLIRHKKKLEIHCETHTLGIFDRAAWMKLLKENNYTIKTFRAPDIYRPFINNTGEYQQTVFLSKNK